MTRTIALFVAAAVGLLLLVQEAKSASLSPVTAAFKESTGFAGRLLLPIDTDCKNAWEACLAEDGWDGLYCGIFKRMSCGSRMLKKLEKRKARQEQ